MSRCGYNDSPEGKLEAQVTELLRVPFKEGGRDPETGLDCLGVTLYVLRVLLGRTDVEDPWDRLERIWQDGWRDIDQAIPEGWQRVWSESAANGDLVIWRGHVGVIVQGWVVSAAKGVGVFRQSLARAKEMHRELQLWRAA